MAVRLHLVDDRPVDVSSVESASLIADYLAFDRRRTERRQYMKAFGGMAIIVLLGTAFGRVPANEAWIVAGLLMILPVSFALSEARQRYRLQVRLNQARARLQSVRKS